MTTTDLDDLVRAAGDALDLRAGLRTTAATRARLESCLLRRATTLGVPLAQYVDQLRFDTNELQLLIDGLTVQETSFFRDPQHIDALIRHVLHRHTGPVVIWSAGCATGAEPYSIAMALDEIGVGDFRVVATDLSREAVERTVEGRYRESELRGLSAARRGRYMVRDGMRWRVDDDLRQRVTVMHHNLLTDPIPLATGEAAAVFCRNVFIYLCRERIDAFLGCLRGHLVDHGMLFLGGSETLWTVPPGWSLTRIGDVFAYRLAPEGPPERAGTPLAARSVPQVPAVAPVALRPPAVTPSDVASDVAACADREASPVELHRRAVYLAPDDALAHLQLALSLEAAGDTDAGRRSFRAARAALERTDLTSLEDRLEGYGVDALRTMIDAKLTREGPCP